MDSFDSVWLQLMDNIDVFRQEYRNAFLLKKFEKLVDLMSKDMELEQRIRKLYKQSYDKINTTKLVMERNVFVELSDEDASYVLSLLYAHWNKLDYRTEIDIAEKKKMYNKQNGRCAICYSKESIGKMHIDHDIPWKIVGDELEDNYQLLCEKCNLKKGSKVVYKLMNIMKLN